MVFIKEDVYAGNFTQSKGELCAINSFTATDQTFKSVAEARAGSIRGIVYASKYGVRTVVDKVQKTVFKSQLIVNKLRPVAYRKFNLNAVTLGGVVAPISFEMAVCNEYALQLKNRTFSIREIYGIRQANTAVAG